MRRRVIQLVSCFLLCTHISIAQKLLTVKEAIAIALENNYDIKLFQNNLKVAQQNVTPGNAGMLPTVTGNFTQNNSVSNSNQTQATGEVRSLDNAKNNSLNYGVSVGWTVFDGLGMFSRYETLKELQKQGEVELQRSVVTRISDVISTYYTIVEQQNLLMAIDTSIEISRERLRTSENRFSIGKASRLEVLNVQVNLNTDESNRIKQANTVKNLKIALNNLLARDLQQEFSVVEEVNIDETLKLGDMLELAKANNPDLILISINRRLAELDEKTIRANRYPTVRLNGGYNFSESESSLGFVAQSQSRGLTYGVTASVNIFDGFNQRRNERIAKLRIENADLQIAQTNLQIETEISQAYNVYRTNLALVDIEERNEQIARQNLNITLEKYKIGTLSAVEFRDAQENFINAVSRFNAAKTQAKLSETLLMELIGKIEL
ncbi:outer membrane protein TolC [Sphingobacterium alimentarium]|uniref:Outer membrane protein TolC n=1 Tax=Sphingobacterium alimentarium TaxID=797292 RepID=A0A4V2VTZ8_9SPHI|nr:TolC family protein [Sphingobacterium alimentarium]TCV09568.1 outer membrane protein TolC [Sphingobacterium alimentarium]